MILFPLHILYIYLYVSTEVGYAFVPLVVYPTSFLYIISIHIFQLSSSFP